MDYANAFASLEKALAIYAQGRGGATPVRDKQQLVEQLRQAVDAALAFCAQHGTDIAEIEALPPASLDRLTRIGDAGDRLILPDPLRQDFLVHAKWASTLYEAVKPDAAVIAFTGRVGNVIRCTRPRARATHAAGRRAASALGNGRRIFTHVFWADPVGDSRR